MSAARIRAVRWQVRGDACMSCRAWAAWRITLPNGELGPSSCERHRALWLRRMKERAEAGE